MPLLRRFSRSRIKDAQVRQGYAYQSNVLLREEYKQSQLNVAVAYMYYVTCFGFQ